MTIYDIAELAGVSIATVSRVMQGKDNVSQKTRDKVEKVMREHSYVPSMIARGMSSKSIRTVAIVLMEFSNFHQMKIAHQIENYFSTINYSVLMYEAGTSTADIFKFLGRMKEMSVDGIIFVGSVFQLIEENHELAFRLIGDKPVVIANGWIPDTYGIYVDEKFGEETAVRYLAKKGVEEFIFVRYNDTDSSLRKKDGFLQACSELGAVNSQVRLHDKDDMKTLRKFIDRPNLRKGRTGILCADDRIAMMAIKIVTEMGLRIPDDIQIVGFDDSEYALLACPSLTTVNSFAKTIGQKCAELLHEIFDGKAPLEKMILCTVTPELIVRESTL